MTYSPDIEVFDEPWMPPEPIEERGRARLGFVLAVGVPMTALALALALWPSDDVPARSAPTSSAPAPIVASVEAPVDPVAALAETQAQVVGLQQEIAARKAELDTLRDERDQDATRRGRLESEVAALNSRLVTARAQRDGLRGRLETALADLDRETGAHADAQRKVDALNTTNAANVWTAFTESAKIDVCEQMTKRGRAHCRDKLDAWFADNGRRDRFTSCVSTNQSIPVLWHHRGGGSMPVNSEPVGVATAFGAENWYVLYCDPTLPEATVAGDDTQPAPIFLASTR